MSEQNGYGDPVQEGLASSVTLTVTEDDTAIALGSGDIPVLGTPRVVALAEEAACTALAGQLSPEMTTVGVRIEIDHLRATGVGETVVAAATLQSVDGRKLDFDVSVTQGDVEVARGIHRRVITRRDAFSS